MSLQGRYKILSLLGRGGMAEVLAGVTLGEQGFERRIAIKRMLPHSDETLAKMFLDEARIVSCLHHGNIVGILDYGLVDDRPFQVLEFVDGLDCSRLMRLCRERDTTIPIEIALHICTELGHALSYAHEALDAEGKPLGIVHRDVKPANAILSWGGDVKLSDFGIAFAQNRTQLTVAGTSKGTPLYMSPEQFLSGGVDGRSDVFALGCVLHALITGRSPLAGDDVVFSFLGGKPLVLSDELPPDIAPLIERATRYSRTDRYASMSELTAALGQALSQRIDRDPKTLLREWLASFRDSRVPLQPISAEFALTEVEPGVRRFVELDSDGRATSKGRKTRKTPRRRSAALIAAMVLLAAAGGGAALRLGQARRAPVPPVAVSPPTPTPAPPTTLPAPEPPSDEPTKPVEPPVVARSVPSRTKPHHVEKAPPVRPPAALGDETGVISFGGEAFFNAQILIDGQTVGYVPRNVIVPVGRHQVTLVKEGRKTTPRIVDVVAGNTSRHPLEFVPPELR